MRRLRPQEKKRVGEFRYLRSLPEEVNFHRFTKHVARLKRRLAGDPVVRKFGFKNRWRRRVANQAHRLIVTRHENLALI